MGQSLPGMLRRLLKKLLFLFYLLVVILVPLEIGVRLWGYSARHLYDPIYMPFPPNGEIPYVHKPDLANARARGHALINTDSLGLRSKTSGEGYGARPSDEYRIAIVGDSVTFGEGVERTEDTFPQVLEDALNARQHAVRVKVFNFAASAYSVKTMAATLPYRMLAVEPNLVIMAIVPTDFNLARTPSVDSWGYLTDNKLSGVLPKDSKIRLLLRRVHLLYLVRDFIYPVLDRSTKAEEILAAGGLPEEYAFVKQFAETASGQRLAYRIVLLPSLSSTFGNIPSQLNQDSIPLVNLSVLRDEFTAEQFQSSRFDTHPSVAVHKRVGESLASYILDSRLLTPKI